MVESIVNITLDIQDAGASVTVWAKQGDTARSIVVTLSDGGFSYEIAEGCYAVLKGEKPDGSILYNHCDITDGRIVYDFTEQTTAVVGIIPAEICLYGSDDALITSAMFRIIVDGTIYPDGAVESRDEVSALTHLVSEAATVIQTGNETIALGQQTIAESQTATQEAITATGEAEDAAGAAQEAAGAANEAAQLARDATARLEEAEANAIESAETAQGAANTAVASKNTAVQAAEESVSARDEAVAAAARAEAGAEQVEYIRETAQNAQQDVNTLREVVSKFHSNIVEEAEGEVITVSDASDLELAGLKIFGKTIQDGTPTPDTPVPLESIGDSGSVTVTAAGKNLLDPKSVMPRANVTVSNGIVTQINADSYDGAFKGRLLDADMTMVGRYDGIDVVAHRRMSFAFEKNDDVHYILVGLNGQTIDTTCYADISGIPNGSYVFSLQFTNVIQGSVSWCDMQIEAGSTETAYEPYTATTATVSTPNGLPGIPVESGGNYTDSTGQQWICDEVDFARGVYVQRIGFLDHQKQWAFLGAEFNSVAYVRPSTLGFSHNHLKNNSDINYTQRKNLKSNLLTFEETTDYKYLTHGHFRVSDIFYLKVDGMTSVDDYKNWMEENDFKLTYFLPEKIIHKLSEIDPDALAQYAALCTNYPNTTVYNDAGAHMEVSYIADTKLYVDKKFDQLAKALVSST